MNDCEISYKGNIFNMRNNIAVIQSVYRKDKPVLFEQSIISIVEQDCGFSKINYYLCTDGPLGEGLQAVIDKYKSKFYKIISNNTNIGLAASLNRLINSLEDEDYILMTEVALSGSESRLNTWRKIPKPVFAGHRLLR